MNQRSLDQALGVRDVVLFNIVAIVGLRWVALAAAGGNSSVVLWLVALLLFFLPQAFAVIELTRRMPEERGFGTWTAATILILFGLIAVVRFGVANPMSPESFFAGILTLDKLSFWAAICFAFSGLELASVLAGEVRDAARTIPRAVVISGFAIAAMYIVGTLALLVALPGTEINIISGVLQGIAAIGDRIGLGWTTNILALLITLGGIGGLMAWFTGAARMPFVAGVDKYLPASFGKTHPRYGSPYVAVTYRRSSPAPSSP